jgi:hypothetical protein
MRPHWIVTVVVAVLLLAVAFAVTGWPTLYRYEVKHRCVFEPVTEPFENEFSGQEKPPAKLGSQEKPPAKRGRIAFSIEEILWEWRKDAGPWLRFVRAKITDEQYKVHRLTGEMYRLEKGKWILQGILFDKPHELMDGEKAPNGCRRSPDSIEQHSYSRQGPWEVVDKKSETGK